MASPDRSPRRSGKWVHVDGPRLQPRPSQGLGSDQAHRQGPAKEDPGLFPSPSHDPSQALDLSVPVGRRWKRRKGPALDVRATRFTQDLGGTELSRRDGCFGPDQPLDERDEGDERIPGENGRPSDRLDGDRTRVMAPIGLGSPELRSQAIRCDQGQAQAVPVMLAKKQGCVDSKRGRAVVAGLQEPAKGPGSLGIRRPFQPPANREVVGRRMRRDDQSQR